MIIGTLSANETSVTLTGYQFDALTWSNDPLVSKAIQALDIHIEFLSNLRNKLNADVGTGFSAVQVIEVAA